MPGAHEVLIDLFLDAHVPDHRLHLLCPPGRQPIRRSDLYLNDLLNRLRYGTIQCVGVNSQKSHKNKFSMRRATIKEVAAEVGVSAATVSNAYNRPDQLSPELRERVFAAAKKLGYAGPDPVARGLRRGGGGAVGVVYADQLSYAFADPAAVMFLEGVSQAAEEARLGLLLVPGS